MIKSAAQKPSWRGLRFCGSLLLVFALALVYTAIFIECIGWREKVGPLELLHLIFVALALFFAVSFGAGLRWVAARKLERRPVLAAFLVYVVAPAATGIFAVVGFYAIIVFIFFTFYAPWYN